MVDRSKVPEYQLHRVLYYSSRDPSQVVRSRFWVVKLGRDATYPMRCDRAVREVVSRGWCVENSHGHLKPTEVGLAILSEQRKEVEDSITVRLSRTTVRI